MAAAAAPTAMLPPVGPPGSMPGPPMQPPAGGGGSGNRTPVIVAIVAGSIALVVIAVLVVVLLSGGNDSKTIVQAQPSPSSTQATITTLPSALPPELGLVARQLDAQLASSAIGRKTLNDGVLGPYTACQISNSQASVLIGQVIANRQGILGNLASIQTTDPTGLQLVSLLRSAIQYSLDSNYQWQQWINENSSSTCPVNTASEDSAKSISNNQATPAKQTFVVAYNPVAQRYGLPQKSAADF